MKISPIPFKGTIIVTTNKDNDSSETVLIKTTKKQDGELLKATTDIFKYETKTPLQTLYRENTTKLDKKLEEIAGKTAKLSNDARSLFIGGESLYKYQQQYNTSYNKIYYRNENSYSYPQKSIVIDLMEPRERLFAAKGSTDKIKKRIEEIYKTPIYDTNFYKILVSSSPSNCTKAEEAMERVRYYLDGQIDGTDNSVYAKNCDTPANAYKALLKGIMKVMGSQYEKQINVIDENIQIESDDLNKIKRAVHYLDCVNKTSNAY